MAEAFQELLEKLGERKFRLLYSAMCLDYWNNALEEGEKTGAEVAYIKSVVLETLDACDAFSDTGKSKTALKQVNKRFERLKHPQHIPVAGACNLTRPLLAQDLDAMCAMAAGTRNTVALRREGCELSLDELLKPQSPREAIADFDKRMDDLLPPAGDAAHFDTECCTSEVLELAQRIYQDHEFGRMPELADLLEQSGCKDTVVLEHCRAADCVHLRGCWVLDAILGELIAKPKKASAKGKKRHETLKHELHGSRKEVMEILAKSENDYREGIKPGSPSQQFVRESYLGECVTAAVLQHLGFGPIDDLHARLNHGVDEALDYFFGDWWKHDEVDAISLDRSRPDGALRWFEPLQHGLRLAALTGRWDDAGKMCTWIDLRIQQQNRFELNDYEYQWLHLCIASQLRGEPLAGVEEALEALRDCRPRHPRLLSSAWEVVLAQDQKGFDKALKDSIRQFLKVCADDVPNPTSWVALDETLIACFAEHRGLQIPTLPEKLDAALPRPATIGL